MTMELSETYGLIEKYPWYSAGIIELCEGALASSGEEAALELLKKSFVHIPDFDYAYFKLKGAENLSFKDESLATGGNGASEDDNPRKVSGVRVAGMDYFSREDYDSVRQSNDSALSRIAIVDYSVPEEECNAHSSPDDTHLDDIVSETLARIYADQGYPDIAADIYNKLSLQSPEKSAYFASLIENLKK